MDETPVQMAGKRIVPIFLIAASALVFSYLVNRCWPFTADDSFVTLRYSLNLASGYGPVFNPGMQPAEGYTSFLWMLLMAIPLRLGLDAVLFGKVLGIAATLGYLGVACRFASKFGGTLGGPNRLLSSAMLIFFLAAFPPTAMHAVSGMETAVYTLLLLSFL